MIKKQRIMITAGFYLPGFKAGGPIRSISNLANCLGDDYDIFILTSDRDFGGTTAYPGIRHGEWTNVGKAKVRYLAPWERTFRGVCRAISEVEHDLLYLNSFFSSWSSMFPMVGRRMGLLPKRPMLVAPRGEFSEGAIALKGLKKRTYVRLAKSMGIVEDVIWHASSAYEAEDIKCVMGVDGGAVFVASNLSDPPSVDVSQGPRDEDARFHVAFLSRISPMKNLDYALEVMSEVGVPVTFNIFGPAEDREYWQMCQNRMSKFPSHVSAQYHGAVAPEEVPGVLRANDFLLLPTRGENYGHVIAEALAVGTPVLISDQTPWRGLAERGLGFDLPLSDRSKFVEAMEEGAKLKPEERFRQRQATHAAMLRYRDESDDVSANRQMFRQVIEAGNG